MSSKRGLQLDRVVLLGRTLEEYSKFFAFDPRELAGKRVLDVASGVSSFCAQGSALGLDICAVDPIYDWPSVDIARRCTTDLDEVYRAIDLPTYRWTSYKNPAEMRSLRERAYKTFLPHYVAHRGSKYLPGALPHLPLEAGSFDVTFVSYFLFVYQDHLNLDFHKESILELMRVTRGEARIYPLVTFEAERSTHLDAFLKDSAMARFKFEEVRTDFEFLAGSNSYLRITHA